MREEEEHILYSDSESEKSRNSPPRTPPRSQNSPPRTSTPSESTLEIMMDLQKCEQYSRIIDHQVKVYDGSEENLFSFVKQVNTLNKILPEDEDLLEYVMDTVKSKIIGYLATCLKPEDDTLEKIVAKVEQNVLRRGPEFYENKLLTLVGIL